MRTVKFLDLRVCESERIVLLDAIAKVLAHGRIVLGPEVSEFEEKIAVFTGRRFAVGVGSGTDALYLMLRAVGIGPGDEVITTSLSWIATVNAIALTGATPVFADIRDDLNIDPESVKKLISKKTKAILPVHYTGRICDMASLASIASSHGIHVLEDAAQAFGAEYGGQKAGSFGLAAAFSMNPMKVLAACGEAGIVVTDDDKIRDRLISLRYNGTVNRETCLEPSHNGRLDTIQAAILLERLKRFPALIKRRREIAVQYRRLLSDVVLVPPADDQFDVYYTFTVQTECRDELKLYLESNGVETKIQHPLLMPDQPAYSGKSPVDFQRASKLVKKILCIPAHEKMTDNDIVYVAEIIRTFFKSK